MRDGKLIAPIVPAATRTVADFLARRAGHAAPDGDFAADLTRRQAREQFVADVEESIEVLPYTKSTAAEHASLLDHVRRTGRPRGAHDLIIAAHAKQTSRVVVTLDVRARFDDLPGVDILS